MNWPTNGLNTLLEITACSTNAPPCDEKFAKNTLHADNLAALRAVSAEELIQKTSPKPFASVPQFGPVIDGNFLPDSVSAIFSANKQAQIPLLAGWNKNETSFASVGKIGKFTVQNLNGLAKIRPSCGGLSDGLPRHQ
ncbi:MAG: carboxylesterase family protein [Candidatus Acidiferrum sp.]|jgi:carboxylesterase type B